jgi:hypothetical protein
MADGFKFSDMIKRAGRLGMKPGQRRAIDWFRDQAAAVTDANARKLIDTREPFKRLLSLSETSVGRMYMFVYDPKWKRKLPWYDTYPLVIPIDYSTDSFLGLNLHYLPPMARAAFMDKLYTLINNDRMDSSTKIRLTYGILKAREFEPYMRQCIKRYLFAHVRSNFLAISSKEWDIAIMLPTQNFVRHVDDYEVAVEHASIYGGWLRR